VIIEGGCCSLYFAHVKFLQGNSGSNCYTTTTSDKNKLKELQRFSMSKGKEQV
jgi:hypothetical protein